MGTFQKFAAFATHRFNEECDRKLRERLEKNGLPEMRETLLRSEVGFAADDIDGLLDHIIWLFIMVSPTSVFIQGMVD